MEYALVLNHSLVRSNRYTATKYKDSKGPDDDLLRLDNPKEAALVNLWMEAESQTLNQHISAIVDQTLVAPLSGKATDVQLVATSTEKLGTVLGVYEERLSITRYLAGDHYTFADLFHSPYVFYLMQSPKAELVTPRPRVLAWWQEIASPPDTKKVMQGMMFGGN